MAEISNEVVHVVKGSASIDTVCSKMTIPWKSAVRTRIRESIKLVDFGVFRADFSDDMYCVCIVTPLEGDNRMLTVFLEDKQ